MSEPDASDVGGDALRPLPYLTFAVIVIGYLAIIQGGGMLVTALFDVDESLPDNS